MTDQRGISGCPPFNADGENVAERWVRYKQGFKFFAAAIGVEGDDRLRNLFLHEGGQQIQDIFKTFEFPTQNEDGTVYVRTLQRVWERFDERFAPKRNNFFESVFHAIVQKEEEGVDSFVTRLRQAALYCEFADQQSDNIISQFLERCRSNQLRERLLREKNLTLDTMLTIARANEISKQQASTMVASGGDSMAAEAVNAVWERRSAKKKGSCGRCGSYGHFARKCEKTKGKSCHSCGLEGHFASVCHSGKDKGKNKEELSSRQEREKKDGHVSRSKNGRNIGRMKNIIRTIDE